MSEERTNHMQLDFGAKIAHARIDENGNARGGRAGNKNGKELAVTAWYKHTKCYDDGWRVFRATNPAIAEAVASAAEKAVRNPNIGYDQGQRETLFKQLEKTGFDMAQIDTPCECDCSSLVHACLWSAGVCIPDVFRTGKMPEALHNSGEFSEMTNPEYRKSGQYLLRGDILVTPVSGHTAIVVRSGDGACLETCMPEWREVTAGQVWNLRSNPDDRHIGPDNVIGTVRRGERVRYYGVTKSGAWAGIKTGNKKGYISVRAFDNGKEG